MEEQIETCDGCLSLNPGTNEWEVDPIKGIELQRKAREQQWTAHRKHAHEMQQALDMLKSQAMEELADRPCLN
eukprot:2843879-Pyramimonas_sp.AAC.1